MVLDFEGQVALRRSQRALDRSLREDPTGQRRDPGHDLGAFGEGLDGDPDRVEKGLVGRVWREGDAGLLEAVLAEAL